MFLLKRQPNVATIFSGKTIIHLLIRVSIAVGLEWCFGLLYYFVPGSTIVRYAFIIFVSFHGLWILLSTLTLSGIRNKWFPSCMTILSSCKDWLLSWLRALQLKCQAESEVDKPENDTPVSESKSQNLSVEDICKAPETMNSVLFWKKKQTGGYKCI